VNALSRWVAVVLFGLASLTSFADATPDAGGFFNVRTFGAVGDGKTLDSPAIDRAIAAAGATGGGTVLVPAGTYLCGSIHLRSHLHLLLDAGAVILGAPQALDAYDETEPWPANNPFQDGGHCYFHNSLIWGENLVGVSITGPGTIRGGGLVRDDSLLDKMSGFAAWGKKTAAAPQPYPPVRLGNKAIALKLCRGVTIRDLTIEHGGHFAILATGCDNATFDNLTIDTNRDGIDIDCCRNAIVSNCRVNSPNDDAICPKSTYALGRNILTEHVTITNCQVSGYKEGTLLDGTMQRSTGRRNGRIKFGTESSGGFLDCVVSNCTFRSCEGLALEEVDGGVLEDITATNLKMVDVATYAIYLTTGTRNRGGAVGHPSQMRDISISNVSAEGVSKENGIQITGIPGSPIEDVMLENIRLISQGGGTVADAARPAPELGRGYPEPGAVPVYGLFVRHAKNLELTNITLSFTAQDQRPAASFSDVAAVEIDDFKAQTAPGIKAVLIAPDVSGVVVRNSPLVH
jgi:polygalacturonase